MAVDDLHLKYAPVMRFSRGERFFPMSLEDFLSYSALYVKDQVAPLVARGKVIPDDLSATFNRQTVFLRSVSAGSLHGVEMASEWGEAANQLLYKWSKNPLLTWSEEMARSAYDWFSAKTAPATKLFWWNGLLAAHQDKPGGVRAELPRFMLPLSVRDSAIENYQASQGLAPNYSYYYRTVQQGGLLDLQYWFFYSYNDWAGGYGGFNDHEGDWEGLHVFFKLDGNRPLEPPAHVCYLGHHSRLTKPWDHPEVEKVGTHPVVYVAAGSHASYPVARQYPLMQIYNLIDYATGESLTLDHSQWRSRIDLERVPWLLTYLGSWGTRYWLSLAWLHKTLGALVPSIAREVDMPGVSAPRGPRFNDEGGERETWGSPVAFAGLA
ncbi:MAG: hypothetical protein JW850_05880 [Thermoflexales bacterium]|nr:hypothetical protein [Thermoflexales bacterium]